MTWRRKIEMCFVVLTVLLLSSCNGLSGKPDDRSFVLKSDNIQSNQEIGVPISELFEDETEDPIVCTSASAENDDTEPTITIQTDYNTNIMSEKTQSDASDSTTDNTLTTDAAFLQVPAVEFPDKDAFRLEDIPVSINEPYAVINNNNPFFSLADYSNDSFEYYSPLDDLGRCGECIACIGQDMMPTEKRESIGMIKPSGWQLVRYDGIVDGNYLFNRCHLIGYQLTGENANLSNLITGTRFMNTMGMLPFENQVADYIRSTNNHVLYRVTPYFDGGNLLATGVLIEAESVEDNGQGVKFNVFCYNTQPGIYIDYVTGENYIISTEQKDGTLDNEFSP